MKALHLFFFLFGFYMTGWSQTAAPKQAINESETAYLLELAQEIAETDQKYRKYIAAETLDDEVLAKIDAVFDSLGIEGGLKYRMSLNLSLPKAVKDSLWALQHVLDFRNHITLRGIFKTYGYLPEAILGEYDYIQILLLMHPPKDWDLDEYLEEYTSILKEEVRVGRMPAKIFASFYDNVKGKMMRKPQLYGTNERFDIKTKTIQPPLIEDLEKSNKARAEIGLPPLKKGEYEEAGK